MQYSIAMIDKMIIRMQRRNAHAPVSMQWHACAKLACFILAANAIHLITVVHCYRVKPAEPVYKFYAHTHKLVHLSQPESGATTYR